MTKEEARLTLQENFGLLSFEYPGRITEAIKIALEVLSEPSPPSNLDEAAEEYVWRKEEPLSDGERLSFCFNPRIEAFKAGAEWMAGQGINLPAHIFIPSGFKPIYDYSKGEYPAAVHLDCGGSLILEKRLQNFNHNEEVIVQIRKK